MKTAVTALCIVGALIVLAGVVASGIKMLFIAALVVGIAVVLKTVLRWLW